MKESLMMCSVSLVAWREQSFSHSIYILVYGRLANGQHIQSYLMDKLDFQQIVSLLLDIKRSLQKGGPLNTADFVGKIDRCISRVNHYGNICGSKIDLNQSKPFSRQSSLHRSAIVGKAADNIQFDSNQFIMYRKSAGEEINKVNKSFVFKEEGLEAKDKLVEPIESDILLDYFVLRYDLAYNDYEVHGKPGPATDRKVFVDLLTYDNKRAHLHQLQKTESMTNILRQIFSQSKPGQPFILPNFQEPQPKYLFVFTLPECGSIAKEYYRTETICCFVSREFMLGELAQLMNEIARFCFEQQVNEASKANEQHLSEAIVELYAKKTYLTMEKVIENFLEKRDRVTQSKLFQTRIQKPFICSVEDYLQETTEMWSLVKKGRDQELIQTIILLYYLSMLEYKIVLLANAKNRHLISELVLGLTRALQPLTYIYPIVGTTITSHHFQFANSPVPIMVGFWGHERDYQAAKSALKKLVKSQKQMSASQIATQTLLAVVDLEDHSLLFLDGAYKETCRVCKKIQNYIGQQTSELVSAKLSHLTQLLVDGKREEEWMLTLQKNMKVTQMYDYLIYRK